MFGKRLYKGIFNYQGEIHTEFVRADNMRDAWKLLTIRLGVKLNRTSYTMRLYFSGKWDNYKITELLEKGIDKGSKT